MVEHAVQHSPSLETPKLLEVRLCSNLQRLAPADGGDGFLRFIGLMDGKDDAYGMVFPDLPGCTAMGKTVDSVFHAASEALGDWVGIVVARGGKVPAARSLDELRRDPEVIEALAEGSKIRTIDCRKMAF